MGYFPFTASTALTNPMTALGDLIEGGAAGVPERLAIGTTGEVLTVSAGAPAWEASTGNTLTRVLFTVPSSGASHNAGANELTAVSTSAGFGTVVLPTGVPAGTANAVKQIIAGAGANGVVTVSTQGSDVFSFTGGATSQTLTLAGQALLAQYDGTSIWTVYADDLPASQIVVLGQDLGNTSALPEVISTHLTVVTNAAATGTLNLDPTNTRAFVVTQTGNVTTFTLTSGTSYASNIEYSFDLYINPSTFTTAWPGNVTWAGGGSAPTLTPSAVNVLTFATVNAGTTWYGATVDNAPSLPLIVGQGGTGGITLGAYEVVTGGVTSTSPLQNVPGTGTIGQALTSAGASALPAWQSSRDQAMRASTILGETVTRAGQMNTAVAPTSGTLFLTAMFLPAGVVIGHLATGNNAVAAATPTHWWFGLYDNNINQLAVTADQTTTAWAANTYQSLAVATIASGASATFTTTYTGLYYFGTMITAGTVPQIMGVGQNSVSLISQTPVLTGTSDTGQTTPPAFPHTATGITAASNLQYGAAAT